MASDGLVPSGRCTRRWGPEHGGMERWVGIRFAAGSLLEFQFHDEDFASGKRGRRQWDVGGGGADGMAVSARKLAAALWQLTTAVNCSRNVKRRHPLPLEGATKWDYGYFKSPGNFNSQNCSHVKLMENKEITDLRNAVKRERKNRKKLEIVKSILLRNIAEAKLSARKSIQDFEKEKRAKELFGVTCIELVKEIEGKKAEITALRNYCSRMQDEIGKERKKLQIVSVWQEEQAQAKLFDARFILEDKFLEPSNLNRDGIYSSVSLKRSKENRLGLAIGSKDLWKTILMDGKGIKPLRGANSTRPDSRNPHIIRAMRGHVEWPRGIQGHGSGREQNFEKSSYKKVRKCSFLRD